MIIEQDSRSPYLGTADDDDCMKSKASVASNESEEPTSSCRANCEVKEYTPQMERYILDVSTQPNASKASFGLAPVIWNTEKETIEKDEVSNGKYKARERKRVLELFGGSDFSFSNEKFPTFKQKELIVGRVLGQGGFCVVLEILLI